MTFHPAQCSEREPGGYERRRRDDGTFAPADAWGHLFGRRRIVGDCWMWTGSIRGRGANGRGEPYGGIRHEGQSWLVHRLAYTMVNGPIPKGLVIDHTCRQTLCFNPAHLRAVTSRENAAGRDQEAVRSTLARGLAARWGKP